MQSHLRLLSVAIAVVMLGLLASFACGSGKGTDSSDATAPATNEAAAGTADTGDTDTGTALQFYARFPVLWLGQSFNDLPLVRGQITGTVTLVYGDCASSTSTAAPTSATGASPAACKPPIQIDVTQPAGASPAKAVAAANGQQVRTVRGAQAVGNALIFNSGLTVTVTLGDGAPSLDEIFNGLALANAQAVNIRPIAAGESLAPINAPPPAPAQPAPTATP
jgi:hypothetical protein